MRLSPGFFKAAAVCAALTAATTFFVHLWPPPPEHLNSLQFYTDRTYLLRGWVVMLHILLVVISMWGGRMPCSKALAPNVLRLHGGATSFPLGNDAQTGIIFDVRGHITQRPSPSDEPATSGSLSR